MGPIKTFFHKGKRIYRVIKDVILNKIDHIILNAIQKLNRCYMYLIKDKEIENPYGYEDLMPKSDLKRNKQYCETIDWALKNRKIKNIALTGVYGSGKSTILKTYISQHNEYKYLNISLAAFKEENTNDNGYIEKGILKQMFYKEKHKNIPNSRFKKIKNVKTTSILLKLLLIVGVIIIGTLLFNPYIINFIKRRFEIAKEVLGISTGCTSLLVIILGILSSIIVTTIIKKCTNNIRFSKIETDVTKLAKVELTKSDDNAFDKYIDEILYFFETTKYDVVVFEDLDRFNNIEIFSKLRELNLLINNCEQINRRVVFIYALKDDMFSNEEGKDSKVDYKNRAKFFDFIIPVVQIANSSNACDLLINKFKEANQWNGLNEEFISDITILINDMRVLINIYNEFVIYKENLKESEVNENKVTNKLDLVKLLAIIVYKNIYPSDFTKLQDDDGMIYNIFKRKKENVINIRIQQIDDKIKVIEKQIQIAELECTESLKELRMLYVGWIQSKGINNLAKVYIKVNNGSYHTSEYSFSELIENDNLFSEVIKNNNLEYYNGSQWIDIDLKTCFKDETGFDYFKREEIIKLKGEDTKNKLLQNLKKEISNLKNEKAVVKSLPLKTLFEKYEFNEIFDEDIEKEDLLIFLVKQGYINENYQDYISYFYEGTLTQKDKDFIRNVMYEKPMNFEYKLKKLDMILNKLHDYQFRKKYILNYSLVDFIIENKPQKHRYEIYYNLLIQQLVNESDTSFSFIDGYLYCYEIKESNKEIFVKSICKEWSNIWSYIQLKSNFTQEKLDMYLKNIIQFADIDDIMKMNKNSILTKYISKLPYFLKLFSDEKYIEKVNILLKALEVKFDYLENTSYQNKILDSIYENNLYVINTHMIEVLVNHYSDTPNNNLLKSNYTTIKECGGEYILKYINNYINDYIKNVFLDINENINESEDVIIELLNNEEIINTNKYKIIEKENIKIKKLSDIQDKKLWKKIITDQKVDINWVNLVDYYTYSKQLDLVLIDCINKKEVYDELSKILLNCNERFGENYYKDLSLNLIRCNTITEESFNQLVKSIPYRYKNLKIEDLELSRINTLIRNNKLELTTENYDLLRANYNKSMILYIIHNIDDYLENQIKYELNSEEVLQLLDSSIDLGSKIKIIKNVKNIGGNIDLQNKIREYTLKNRINLDESILKEIIYNEEDKEKNINLLVNQMDNLSQKTTFELLNIIGDEYSGITNYGNRPRIERNNINEKLAKKLKEKSYVSTITPEYNTIKINTYQKER
ncbi:hypothetical protein FC959_03515 [Clostridium botulinum]|nr:hypothetical protein [Clostridium botulinum]